MSKKSFKDNPALAYLSNTQHHTQEDAQKVTHDDAHDITQEVAQHDTQEVSRSYTRTQGRKGQKKPRINLAFDSEQFLDEIRACADNRGQSITQLVNEAVAYYLDMKGEADIWT